MLSTVFLRSPAKIRHDKLLFETCLFGETDIFEKNHFPINYDNYQDALNGHLEILTTILNHANKS